MYKSIRSACVSHTGNVRKNNEDNFFFNGEYLPSDNSGTKGVISDPSAKAVGPDDGVFYAVFDGMGGGEYGEIASFRCAEETALFFSDENNINSRDIPDILEDLCSSLNDAVFSAKTDLGAYQVGSTIASVYLLNGGAWACNIGDSKVFWYSKRKQELRQISVDHTDRHFSADNPVLTQYLGIDPEEIRIEPCITFFEPESNDKIILCSDGLTDMLSEAIISETVSFGMPAGNAENMLNNALEAGGRDNISVIVIEII